MVDYVIKMSGGVDSLFTHIHMTWIPGLTPTRPFAHSNLVSLRRQTPAGLSKKDESFQQVDVEKAAVA